MSKFTDLVEKALKGELVSEDSPPGFKGTVKAMKDEGEIDNPYALAWWMKKKGYKSHKKADGTAKETEGERDVSGSDFAPKPQPGDDPDEQRYWGPDERATEQYGNRYKDDDDYGDWLHDVRKDKELDRRWEEEQRQKREKQQEVKGGGKVTQVPLGDSMGASSEGEVANQAYSSYDHQLVDESNLIQPGEVDLDYPAMVDRFVFSIESAAEAARNHGVPFAKAVESLSRKSLDEVLSLLGQIGSKYKGELGEKARFYLHMLKEPQNETTGDNWSQTSGTGTPHSPWVSTDALPDVPLQYDMDQGKMTEEFDFDLTEQETLAAEKGIKRVSQRGNEDGKKTKFMPEPEGAARPDYKKLGAKDVNGADNLSDEAINDEMKDSAYETIRIEHVTKGKGTVLEITESHIEVDWDRSSLRILGPEKLPFSEAKYFIRIKERYSDEPEDVEVERKPKGKKKMTKKQKVDEAMAAIQPTMRETDDGMKLPVIDLSPEDIGLVTEYDLPDPGDSVLTGQDQQSAPDIAPLSTERGADAAHDSIYPDGDFGKDLVPDDAPGTPDYEEMGDDAGNPRSTDGTDQPAAELKSNSAGKSDDVKPDNYDEKKYGDSDEDKDDSDDDDEDKNVKEGLTWEDIGLDINEVAGRMSDHDVTLEDETCEGCGEMMDETHDTGAGEVAFTPELLKKLMSAVRDQSPDDDKLQRMCDALKDASSEKGATLDDSDMGSIMDKYKNGAAAPVADEPVGDVEPEGDSPSSVGGPDAFEKKGEDNEAGDVRKYKQHSQGDDDKGVRDDEHGDEAEDNEFEDKAEGDGEEAGPEGGDEHEGKTKLMDKKGKDQDDDGDVDSDDWKISRDKAIKKNRKDKQKRKYASMENKGKKIKPVSQNTSKGSGPGGGNVSDDGQDPLIPAMAKGSQRGTPGTPLSKEGGGRTVKPVSESMVALGMAAINPTARNIEAAQDDDDGLTEEERELRMIKRRAGLEDWWK